MIGLRFAGVLRAAFFFDEPLFGGREVFFTVGVPRV
jgi:hypothetical protein